MKEIIQRQATEYKIVINNFEGPLDLLVFLINKNKMSIFDVSLSELTDKYIEFLDEMTELNLEITSEFIVMASTLLDIKSRKLLPELEPKQEDEISEEDLISRIVMYKKYKEIAEQIRVMYENNFGFFSRLPEIIKYKEKVSYSGEDLDIKKLKKIYEEMLQRNQNKVNLKASEIQKLALYEKITVKDKVNQIVKYLNRHETMVFNDMFNLNECDNLEVVTAFLGMLELSKLKQIYVDQRYLFSEINVRKNNDVKCGSKIETIFK
ncbi:MAG: segregation/condensation protein A [Clostridia bacterium]|nr:segregation/condensation protein A [Clostridia bacterium]